MKAVLLACFLAISLPLLLLQTDAQDLQPLPQINISALFPEVPRSEQRPSEAGIIGVSVATVALVVFSCSFVFLLGAYEEFCLRSGHTNKGRASTVGSRYGGSRYGRGKVRTETVAKYRPPRPEPAP